MAEDDGLDLVQRVFGIVESYVLATVVRLGVPDVLSDDGTDVAGAAGHLGLSEPLLTRLLRAAASLGVVTEVAPGRFAPTASGRMLRRDHPSGMWALTRLFTEPIMVASLPGLDTHLRTGEIPFDAVHGAPLFELLATNPEGSEVFNTAMQAWTRHITGPVAQRAGLDRFGTVVDVGGGNGTLLARVLGAHPSLHGIVFDSPDGAARAPATLAAAGVGDRCTVETGDFFSAVPAGGDAYLLKHIIHDWDDERAATILRRCREVLPDHGRVLVLEMVLPDTAEPGVPVVPYMLDIATMTVLSGRERTRAEYAELFRRAGLEPDGVTELAGTLFSVLEAVPAR